MAPMEHRARQRDSATAGQAKERKKAEGPGNVNFVFLTTLGAFYISKIAASGAIRRHRAQRSASSNHVTSSARGPSLRAMHRRDRRARTTAPSLPRTCRLIRPPASQGRDKRKKGRKRPQKVEKERGRAFIRALRTLNRCSIALMSVPIMKKNEKKGSLLRFPGRFLLRKLKKLKKKVFCFVISRLRGFLFLRLWVSFRIMDHPTEHGSQRALWLPLPSSYSCNLPSSYSYNLRLRREHASRGRDRPVRPGAR